MLFSRPILPCLFLLALLSLGCGRRPSGEFDDRPPIPTAPVALPESPETPGEERAGHASSTPGSGVDLRAPGTLDGAGEAPPLPERGPAQTYTYVPVPSPREVPGEKVPTTSPPPSSKPKLQTLDPAKLPAGLPVTAPPPPPPGAPSGAPPTGAPDLRRDP